jgi:hypothetical protein
MIKIHFDLQQTSKMILTDVKRLNGAKTGLQPIPLK